jgi:hypothetical protein
VEFYLVEADTEDEAVQIAKDPFIQPDSQEEIEVELNDVNNIE